LAATLTCVASMRPLVLMMPSGIDVPMMQSNSNAAIGRDGPFAETEAVALFDHLLGDRKQHRRINAERLCGLEIDDKFELDRLVGRHSVPTPRTKS
jgi:hypothetical protein